MEKLKVFVAALFIMSLIVVGVTETFGGVAGLIGVLIEACVLNSIIFN